MYTYKNGVENEYSSDQYRPESTQNVLFDPFSGGQNGSAVGG